MEFEVQQEVEAPHDCAEPPISSQEGEKDLEIQFSGSIELNPRPISSVSKSLVHSLEERHCCADWETLLTFNLSCFKNQFSTLRTCGKSKRRCLVPKVRRAGIIGRFHGRHTHDPVLFSFCSLPSWRNHKAAPQIFGIIQNGLLSCDFASGAKVISL